MEFGFRPGRSRSTNRSAVVGRKYADPAGNTSNADLLPA